MFIPDEVIEEVRASTDIVEIIGDYVSLKKKGINYLGLCPFHNEKTPSFNVNPARGIYKCFGCGVGGDVFNFVMSIERVGFQEAVRMLAERAGIPLPLEQSGTERSGEFESIYNALRFSARFYYQQLTQTREGRAALDYFKKRGFTASTIKKFGLGYAPVGWDTLSRVASENHITPELLEKAGLIIPKKEGGGYYDRFRDRVIFPIFSHVGKILGFGGRVLQNIPDQPKYINSPETLVYNKSRVLYGLYQAKHAIRQREEAILVEGYTDVISLHQAGVEHVVASSGTALTIEQLKLISRYARRIILLYDADSAGSAATLRGIDLALEQGLAVYPVALSAGHDPDTFVREVGPDMFTDYLKSNRQDFISFKYQEAARSGAFDTPEGRAASMRGMVETIARVPDRLTQETYIHRASEVLGIPDIRLFEVLEEIARTQKRPSISDPEVPIFKTEQSNDVIVESDKKEVISNVAIQSSNAVLPEEKLLIRLMLENPAEMLEFILGNMALEEFSVGPARKAVKYLLEMYEKGEVDPKQLLDSEVDPEVQRLAAEVLIDRHEPSENWQRKQNIFVPRFNQDQYEAASSAMEYLKLDRVKEAIERQRELIYRASLENQDIRDLQQEMMSLHKLKSSIERREFLKWHRT